jgi:hypothetical protein
MGRVKGRQEGLHQEIASMHRALLEVLEVRFGPVPAGLAEALSTVSDLDTLKALHRAALTSPDLKSFVSASVL